jgi:3-oxoacyl-[acyl-carrier protein] reductase
LEVVYVQSDRAIQLRQRLTGATETEVERETVTPGQTATMIAMRCIRRAETPDDLIGLALFLASDASAFLTSQSITVDGGLTHL